MSDVPRSFDRALAGQYRLDRILGEGGMATVYLAQDLKHDRPVALKVLRPELAHALGPERFGREIHLAARLQHPHILTVHDSGDADGQLWFTMPYVEGESLRARLARERQLSVRDAVRIVREAAQALQYAHQRDVVHRDIKPDNILLTTDGSTLVADFGIARALHAEAGTTLTRTGMSLGTPVYMSPEQASGERDVDTRTDIYALGVVLYELLAGEPPFTGPTAQAIIAKRFSQAPPSVRAVRPSVPEVVDRAIQRALAPVPSDRFPTAAAFSEALDLGMTESGSLAAPLAAQRSPARRWALASTLVIGLAVLGGGLLYALRGEPGTASSTSVVTDPTRVAVLPFENLGDSADAYFADGVTDAVRGKLTGLAGLEVIARSSSEPYRGSMKALQQIAQELGVHYLLTGTVRWAKGPDGSSRVQVRPELVEVGDGTARSRWQEPFDAPLTDVFQVQSEIASQVAGALDVALGVSERQELAERPTRDLAAYDAYLKGQAIPGTDIESLRRAIAFFEQAVALDSSFGVAWGRLAGSLAMLHRHTRTNSLLAPITEALARARRLAPNAVDTYDARSYYESVVRSDNAAALAVVEEGLKRHPASPELLRTAGSLEIALGRVDSGVARMQRAMAMDPRSVRAARALGSQLVLLHRWRGARESYARAAAIVPGDLQALVGLIHAHLGEGDLVGARRVIDEAPPTTDRLQLFANLTIYGDLYWVLSRAQQDTVLALPASYFDDDRGSRALGFAQIFHQRGDVASARLWADSARIHFEARQRNETNPGQFPAVIGLALAYQGRYADAVVSAERGAGAATGVSTDRIVNYSREALARIHALGGDHARAVGRLQQLLPAQHNISPAWLRIDPAYVALHGDPGFERLTAGR